MSLVFPFIGNELGRELLPSEEAKLRAHNFGAFMALSALYRDVTQRIGDIDTQIDALASDEVRLRIERNMNDLAPENIDSPSAPSQGETQISNKILALGLALHREMQTAVAHANELEALGIEG